MENSLVGEKTIAFSIAHEILTTSVNIPTLPANGKKILDTVRLPEEKIHIPSFVRLVESDPGLFVRILQLSNSVFFGQVEKIVSLRAAITRIGLVETVNTVCLYFFQKMLPKFPDIKGFTYHEFWSHSWVCAAANRRLGHPQLGLGIVPGDLYMAGMLNGLGKLLLAIHFPDEFLKCVKRAKEHKQPLHMVEKDVFGTTDALIASRVLHTWNFPAIISEGIAYHQMPELAPPEYKIISGLTQFAYVMAEKIGIGCSGDGIETELSSTFIGQKQNLELSKPTVQQSLIKEVKDSMKNMVGTVADPSEDSLARSKKTKPFAASISDNSSSPVKEKPKGLIGWAKSLFR